MNTTTKVERITQLEANIFYLSMKDRWTTKDYEQDRAWNAELRELTKED